MKYTVLTAAVFLSSAAHAQEILWLDTVSVPCIDYDAAQAFANSDGEQSLFIGLGIQEWSASDGSVGTSPYVMKFLVNQNTGTWQMLQIYADGSSCLVMWGTDFEPYSD